MIRKAERTDLPAMLVIAEEARQTMRDCGNLNQWTDGYPSAEVLEGDIERGVSYVIVREGTVAGMFALIPGPDVTYNRIYEGQWLNDEPYFVIHRIGSRKGVGGVLKEALDFGFKMTENIRIDTHRDNCIMRHLLEKSGFAYCGIIFLLNGDERLAYQKNGNRKGCSASYCSQ